MSAIYAVLPVLSLQIAGLLSPGPDFALLLKHSLSHSRRQNIGIALGITVGMVVHAAYSIYLLPYLIAQNQIIIAGVRYLGSAYLLYIGMLSLKAAFTYKNEADTTAKADETLSTKQSLWLKGFLCNVLNPKAILFYISIFTVVLSKNSLMVKNICAAVMVLMSGLWFTWLALVLTNQKVQEFFKRSQHVYKIIYGLSGCVFIAFSILFVTVI